MRDFLKIIKEKVLVGDGGMGTSLQKIGLLPGESSEAWNLTNVEAIKNVHRSFIVSGSDIILTNTFGANRIKLSEFGLERKICEINQTAVRIAKECAQDQCYVGASMGPTGQFIYPYGTLSFDDAYNTFKEQAVIFEQSGADFIITETMSDIGEMRAALLAIKENTSLPIVVQMTFSNNLYTLNGVRADAFALLAEKMGADVIGANCSGGPQELLPVIEKIISVTNLPIICQPNAGLPIIEDGKTIYPLSPDEAGIFAEQMVEMGVNIIGGCCGMTDAHIKKIAEKVKGASPKTRMVKRNTFLTSKSKVLWFGNNEPVAIIGERINPSGKKELRDELAKGSMELVKREAIEQEKFGAAALDVNVGIKSKGEAALMKKAVLELQKVVDIPLVIDSTHPETIEAGLRNYHGRALVNSVNGDTESLDKILPIVKKYGAAVIGLTLDENGIAETVDDKIRIAEKIIARSKKEGLREEDIFIDTLVLAVATNPEHPMQCLKALQIVKEKFNVKTVLGVSNISFGLPQRPIINKTFLAFALAYGLDAPIVDPLGEDILDTCNISSLLLKRGSDANKFISSFFDNGTENKKLKLEEAPEKSLYQAVLYGDKENITDKIDKVLTDHSSIEIVNKILIPALNEVGRLYAEGKYYLPQLMLSAETMKICFKYLEPLLKAKGRKKGKKVIIATVKGDIHDIGKNIVALMLENHGFDVYDLGKDVPLEKIIHAAEKEKPDFIGLSALMTTTLASLEEAVREIKKRFTNIRVIVGGAVVTEKYAKEIGADFYGKDAVDAVKKLS